MRVIHRLMVGVVLAAGVAALGACGWSPAPPDFSRHQAAAVSEPARDNEVAIRCEAALLSVKGVTQKTTCNEAQGLLRASLDTTAGDRLAQSCRDGYVLPYDGGLFLWSRSLCGSSPPPPDPCGSLCNRKLP